jgi:hypothetical protein
MIFPGQTAAVRPPLLQSENLTSAYGRLQILLGLPNFVRLLRTLRLDSGRGPPTPALFIDVFRLSSFCEPSSAPLPAFRA